MIPQTHRRRRAPAGRDATAAARWRRPMPPPMRRAARTLALALGVAAMVPAAARPAAAAPVLLASVDPALDAYAMDAPDPTPLPDPAPDPAGSTGWPTPGAAPAAPHARGDAHRGWGVFGQMTVTGMADFGFPSPYAGPASLTPGDLRETFDATLYLGLRPWAGGEVWADAEVLQGYGIGNALGMAGYASGEAYNPGSATPYLRMQRLFVRQTINLGGARSPAEAQANQLAGSAAADRLVLTLGKFCVADVFDTNRYAHDPRADFLNLAIVEAGAFDYAQDPWGYSLGAAVEGYAGDWTLRAGVFNLTTVPGGATLRADFGQTQAVIEGEHRHAFGGHPGALRVAVWRNHGRLARYAEAVAWGAAHGAAPDGAQVLRSQDRWGGYINAEQELTGNLGAFFRASIADGAGLSAGFTDIDRSLSGGLALAGKGWGRGQDTLALAVAGNAVSRAAVRYFDAGGLGLMIGDGQLPHPGTEAIVEVSYTWRPNATVAVTADAQAAINPAYNRDRGPVAIVGLRVHAGF